MIDTIAYTPEGEVQIGGRGAAGALLRLYLDNAEKATLPVPQSGLWTTTLPDTARASIRCASISWMKQAR